MRHLSVSSEPLNLFVWGAGGVFHLFLTPFRRIWVVLCLFRAPIMNNINNNNHHHHHHHNHQVLDLQHSVLKEAYEPLLSTQKEPKANNTSTQLATTDTGSATGGSADHPTNDDGGGGGEQQQQQQQQQLANNNNNNNSNVDGSMVSEGSRRSANSKATNSSTGTGAGTGTGASSSSSNNNRRRTTIRHGRNRPTPQVKSWRTVARRRVLHGVRKVRRSWFRRTNRLAHSVNVSLTGWLWSAN